MLYFLLQLEFFPTPLSRVCSFPASDKFQDPLKQYTCHDGKHHMLCPSFKTLFRFWGVLALRKIMWETGILSRIFYKTLLLKLLILRFCTQAHTAIQIHKSEWESRQTFPVFRLCCSNPRPVRYHCHPLPGLLQ